MNNMNSFGIFFLLLSTISVFLLSKLDFRSILFIIYKHTNSSLIFNLDLNKPDNAPSL